MAYTTKETETLKAGTHNVCDWSFDQLNYELGMMLHDAREARRLGAHNNLVAIEAWMDVLMDEIERRR